MGEKTKFRRLVRTAAASAVAMATFATVPAAVAQEVDGVVVGGPAAVSEPVFAELAGCLTGEARRVSGVDRYGTAASIAMEYFAAEGPVFLATGEDFPDALTTGVVAQSYKVFIGDTWRSGPVLLTRYDSVPISTISALKHLNPSQVIIVGGSAAISEDVEAEIRMLVDSPVVRIAGSDRYETAEALLRWARRGADANGVALASGRAFADALSASQLEINVVLSEPESIPPPSLSAIQYLEGVYEAGHVIMAGGFAIGGAAALAPKIEQQIADAIGTGFLGRIAGPDRYGTAAEISAHRWNSSGDGIFFATGQNFPDALAIGPALAVSQEFGQGWSLLLVQRDRIPESTRAEIERLTGRECPPLRTLKTELTGTTSEFIILGEGGRLLASRHAGLSNVAVTAYGPGNRYETLVSFGSDHADPAFDSSASAHVPNWATHLAVGFTGSLADPPSGYWSIAFVD